MGTTDSKKACTAPKVVKIKTLSAICTSFGYVIGNINIDKNCGNKFN